VKRPLSILFGVLAIFAIVSVIAALSQTTQGAAVRAELGRRVRRAETGDGDLVSGESEGEPGL
jgi:hypothetical protein